MNDRHAPSAAQQRGVVLIVSLMFLLVLTLIAVTGMRTTSLEEKMAGNMRDRNLALQKAENALKGTERWLGTLQVEPDRCASGGAIEDCAWPEDKLPELSNEAEPEDRWRDEALWIGGENNGGLAATYDGTLGGIGVAPRLFLEKRAFLSDGLTLGFPNSSGNTGRQIYQLTARGTGSTTHARVLVQTDYSKRYD